MASQTVAAGYSTEITTTMMYTENCCYCRPVADAAVVAVGIGTVGMKKSTSGLCWRKRNSYWIDAGDSRHCLREHCRLCHYCYHC